MGNAASTERGGGGGGQHQRNQKLIVKPPPEWTAHTETQKFVVVSPQSDISNPSQIRHPHHFRKATTMTSKTPMRKRASKVVSKGGPPAMQHNLVTDLPEPETFFFDPSTSTDPSRTATDSQEQVALIPDENKRRLQAVIKAKATRARRILQGCWKEQKGHLENCYRENEHVEHERFQSMSPVKMTRSNCGATASNKKKDAMPAYGQARGPQFIPDIEEEDEYYEHNNTLSPRQVYLHDEESYMKRMQPKHEVNESPLKDGVNHAGLYSSEGGSVENSPVAKLFDRRGQSDSGLLYEAKKLLSESKMRHSCPEQVEHSPAGKNMEQREPNTVEREIQKQIDEQVQLQFESKSEEIGRVKRLRESYLQRLESTKRLSQEEDSRRKSIESKMEEMREKIVSEEFEEFDSRNILGEEKEPDIPFDEKSREDMSKHMEKENMPKPFDEDKANIRRGRASAPVQRSTNAHKPSKPLRKSEPIVQAKRTVIPNNNTNKSNLPVLLKIAGWEEVTKKNDSRNNAAPKPQHEIPAVLQLAGWKQAANEKREPVRRLTESSMGNSTVEHLVSKPSFRESDVYKVNAQKEYRAMKKDTSEDDDSSEDENRIPMPYELQTIANDPPKDTPIVQKMSRMLLQSGTFSSSEEPPQRLNPYGAPLTSTNLDDSMESDATPFSEASGRHLITQDALVNAAFLFSPSYVNNDATLLRLGDSKSVSTTTISTADSRNRLLPSYASTVSTFKPTEVQAKSSASSNPSGSYTESEPSKPSGVYTATDESSTSSDKENVSRLHSLLKTSSSSLSRSTDSGDRHVRFSIGNKVIESSAKKQARVSNDSSIGKSPLRSDSLEVPAIEHKMSDLTDIFTSARNSLASVESHKPHRTSPKESIDLVPSDDTPTAKESETSLREHSPPSNWSYSVDMDNGVTPLRSGKGGRQSNATNSPHKRFNEAKSKFSTTKISPAKKRSPVKRGASRSRISEGLVFARVAAMESRTTNVSAEQPKTRRDTLAHKAIAPRKAVLKSPHFKANIVEDKQKPKEPSPQLWNAAEYYERRRDSDTSESIASRATVRRKSSMISQDPIQNVPLKRFSLSTASLSAGYRADNAKSLDNNEDEHSDSDSDDVFGAIRHAATVDEDDKKETGHLLKNSVQAPYRTTSHASQSIASTEASDDDFAAILQYQTSIDEDDESTGELTVSTIQRNRMSSSSSTVMSGSTAPTVFRRSSIEETSTAMSSGGTAPTVVRRSSVVSGSSIPTVARHEAAELERSSYPPRSKLPFREEALVRPTEQSHRAAPGALVLSPMQRTPMQAMKWRALAAAEKEKTERTRGGGRRSLSERHPNVVAHY